jgi:hypothetical protein
MLSFAFGRMQKATRRFFTRLRGTEALRALFQRDQDKQLLVPNSLQVKSVIVTS